MVKILNKLSNLSSKIKGSSSYDEENEDILATADEDELEAFAEAEIEDEENDEWLEEDYEEGQLSIDVYQTPEAIMVKSTIAGVKPKDIDIALNNDMLTIRGKREMEETIREENYLFKECYWGSFSRSIILPVPRNWFVSESIILQVLPSVRLSFQKDSTDRRTQSFSEPIIIRSLSPDGIVSPSRTSNL